MAILSSVSQNIALAQANHTYTRYRNLVEYMGKPVNVPFTVEGLAEAQAAMVKARKLDLIAPKPVGVPQEEWDRLVEDARRLPAKFFDFEVYDTDLDVWLMHPIFPFAEHFMSKDGTWKDKGGLIGLHIRGDCLSIPMVSEGSEVYYLTTAFHKGNTSLIFTYFPYRDLFTKEQLVTLLRNHETR